MIADFETIANERQPNCLMVVIVSVVIILAGATTLVWYVMFENPLPSDEEMIAHFQQHRADFELLEKRFREYRLPEGEKPRYWAATPETEALMKRVGIEDVNNLATLWFPNPYSVETAKHIDSMIRKPHSNDLFREYGALRFRPDDQRYYTKSLRYLTDFAIWKDFHHIPEVPRVERGMLFGPMNVDGTSNPHYRVLASLDHYPDKWMRGECVLRQLEKHWFIRMCRAA